jgi:hypothetical protein
LAPVWHWRISANATSTKSVLGNQLTVTFEDLQILGGYFSREEPETANLCCEMLKPCAVNVACALPRGRKVTRLSDFEYTQLFCGCRFLRVFFEHFEAGILNITAAHLSTSSCAGKP